MPKRESAVNKECEPATCGYYWYMVVDISADAFSVPQVDNSWYDMPKPRDGTYGLQLFVDMRQTFENEVYDYWFDFEDCNDPCHCEYGDPKPPTREPKTATVMHVFKDGGTAIVRGSYVLETTEYPGECKPVELLAVVPGDLLVRLEAAALVTPKEQTSTQRELGERLRPREGRSRVRSKRDTLTSCSHR